MNYNIKNQHKPNHFLESCITAILCDQVSTADLNLALDRSCENNSLQIVKCDNHCTNVAFQKIYTNVMTNKIHTFGFCPLTPLEFHKGDSVCWNSISSDLETHHLITDSGKPNFLATRLPVAFNLSSAK